MKTIIYKFIIIILVCGFLNKAYAIKTIKVVDLYNFPITQAQILIGTELNSPYPNNFYVTNQFGELNRPTEWLNEQTLTVEAPGFIRQSLIGINPQLNSENTLLIKLNLQLHSQPVSIEGEITDLPIVNKDKLVNFSLVTKNFNLSQLKNISHKTFLSPYADQITLLGKNLKVFSNASIPTQKESYGVPLTIEKPVYTFFENQNITSELLALSGDFPFSTVVDELKSGKSFYDIINLFKIQTLNSFPINFKSSQSKISFSGIKFNLTEFVELTNTILPADQTSFIIPMNQINNQYWPTAIKKLNSQEKTHFFSLKQNLKILSLIKPTSELEIPDDNERLSASFTDLNKFNSTMTLPLLTFPSYNMNDHSIMIDPISLPPNLIHTLQSVVLSKVYSTSYKNQEIKNHFPIWEIYSTNQLSQINLPLWPLGNNDFQSINWSSFAWESKNNPPPLTFSIYDLINQSNFVTKSVYVIP